MAKKRKRRDKKSTSEALDHNAKLISDIFGLFRRRSGGPENGKTHWP